METITRTLDQIEGYEIIGGGADRLVLSGSGTFKLNYAVIGGFKEISFADDDATIEIDASQLAGLEKFSAPSEYSNDYDNRVKILGKTVDLQSLTTIENIGAVSLEAGVTAVVDSISIGTTVRPDYYESFNDTLRVDSVLLTASSRIDLFEKGWDNIIDRDGKLWSNARPSLTGLTDLEFSATAGGLVRLDPEGDAVLVHDDVALPTISFTPSSSDYMTSETGGEIKLGQGFSFGAGKYAEMHYNGVHIGWRSLPGESYYSQTTTFSFNSNATADILQQLVRTAEFQVPSTIKNDRDISLNLQVREPGDRYTNYSFDITVSGTGGVDNPPPVDGNHAPTAPQLSAASIIETALPGAVIGTFSATDPDGDALSYGITDTHGGLFRVEGNNLILGGALDFEKRSSYTFQATSSDGRGGVSYSPITINVADVVGEAGTGGSDVILGGPAKDKLAGGFGDDKIGGGLGNDILTGGVGRDTFVFNTKPGKKNVDAIIDFKPADDTIQLSLSAFKKAGKIGGLKKGAFYQGTKSHDKDDRIIYDKKSGALFYDADGTGKSPMVKFATVKKKTALSFKDFDIIA
jgi:hypothetical protein